MKYLKILFVFVVFLQLTDAYKLIILAFGYQTNVASMITLCFMFIYIVLNIPAYKALYQDRIFKMWLNIIFTIPILSFTYHLFRYNVSVASFFYWLSFTCFFGTLYVGTAIFFYKEKGNKLVNYLFIISIITTAIGFFISIINYTFILRIMALSRARTDATSSMVTEIQRAVGFFTQSNVAAKAVVLYFIVLFATYLYTKSKKINLIAIVVFVALVFWTGSRTSLILAFFALIFYVPSILYPEIFNKEAKGMILYKSYIIFRFVFIAIIGVFILSIVSEKIANMGYDGLGSRLSFIENIFENDSVVVEEEDASIATRLSIIDDYIYYISENLFLGKGPDFRNEMRDSGEFSIGAQNEYLETGLSYGALYVFYYLYVMIKTYMLTSGVFELRKIYSGKALRILILVLVMYGFSVNNIFFERVQVITMGVLVGLYLRDKKRILIDKKELKYE